VPATPTLRSARETYFDRGATLFVPVISDQRYRFCPGPVHKHGYPGACFIPVTVLLCVCRLSSFHGRLGDQFKPSFRGRLRLFAAAPGALRR
jgi:hypothetical protein